jgi:hypothetical protein
VVPALQTAYGESCFLQIAFVSALLRSQFELATFGSSLCFTKCHTSDLGGGGCATPKTHPSPTRNRPAKTCQHLPRFALRGATHLRFPFP